MWKYLKQLKAVIIFFQRAVIWDSSTCQSPVTMAHLGDEFPYIRLYRHSLLKEYLKYIFSCFIIVLPFASLDSWISSFWVDWGFVSNSISSKPPSSFDSSCFFGKWSTHEKQRSFSTKHNRRLMRSFKIRWKCSFETE